MTDTWSEFPKILQYRTSAARGSMPTTIQSTAQRAVKQAAALPAPIHCAELPMQAAILCEEPQSARPGLFWGTNLPSTTSFRPTVEVDG